MLIFICRLFSDTGGSSGSPLGKGILISGFPFLSGFGSTDVHKVYCVSGPTEAPGHPCAQQPGRLAHPAPIQGVEVLSQGHSSSPPPSVSWPQVKHQEKCYTPSQRTVFLGVQLDSVLMQFCLAHT